MGRARRARARRPRRADRPQLPSRLRGRHVLPRRRDLHRLRGHAARRPRRSRHGCYRGSRAQSVPMAIGRTVHRSTWRSVDRFLALTPFHADFLRLARRRPRARSSCARPRRPTRAPPPHRTSTGRRVRRPARGAEGRPAAARRLARARDATRPARRCTSSATDRCARWSTRPRPRDASIVVPRPARSRRASPSASRAAGRRGHPVDLVRGTAPRARRGARPTAARVAVSRPRRARRERARRDRLAVRARRPAALRRVLDAIAADDGPREGRRGARDLPVDVRTRRDDGPAARRVPATRREPKVTQANYRVAIVQETVPHYRVPFFADLRKALDRPGRHARAALRPPDRRPRRPRSCASRCRGPAPSTCTSSARRASARSTSRSCG